MLSTCPITVCRSAFLFACSFVLLALTLALTPSSLLLADDSPEANPARSTKTAPVVIPGVELLSNNEQCRLRETIDLISRIDKQIVAQPKNVKLLSQRGDVHFTLGHFTQAVADYDWMVTLDPSLDTSHWRRGIALFYAGDFDKAARQFERYHAFDNVDRENGIWRYLCQVKADGTEKARAGLLKYEKDDREPFGDVYRLFASTITPDEIVKRIEQADISDVEREKRRFYAHLYIGLWHAVHDRPSDAKPHLKQAVVNTWAPEAGYGPRWMWHVGRLHYDRLPGS